MSMPYFDLRKAQDQIDNSPALLAQLFKIGKHVFVLEKVATIWHLQRPEVPDFVFRLTVNGTPLYSKFGRVFFHPCSDFYRSMNTRRKILIDNTRPEWLPEGVTIKAMDVALDEAMQDMLSAN